MMNSILTVSDGLDTMAWNQHSLIESSEMRERDESIDAGTLAQKTYELGTSAILDPAALKSILPQSLTWKHSPRPFFDPTITRDFVTPQLRQVLFSLANNLAGLDGADMGKIARFLQNETSQRLFQLICSDSEYSSRAIAQSIFKGAIEIGDARLGDLLLSRKSLGIDVNLLWCHIKGYEYTPIERASCLRHKEMIKVLLKHGAYVNRKYHHVIESCKSALEHAVSPVITTNMEITRVDPEIFEMLLNAGGDLSADSLGWLIQRREGEFVSRVMSANAHKNVATWSATGIFIYAVHFLDDRTALNIIRVMLDIRANLNICVTEIRHPKPCLTTVIDAAAQRGNTEMVELLLRSGAFMTHETLPLAIMSGNHVLIERLLRCGALVTQKTLCSAIRSGNHDLVRSLLDRGVDVSSNCSDRAPFQFQVITPLSEAIRLKNDEIIGLLERYGAFRLDDQSQFSAAILAASKVGNMPFIKRLVRLGSETRTRELGCALAIAIKEGHDEAVTMLIDAGAILNEGFGEPLVQAVTRHNAALVHLLLEAGAFAKSYQFLLATAVEWGDLSVIKALIFARTDEDSSHDYESALIVAVKRQDHALVNLLLDNGADVDKSFPLGIAIQRKDFTMACHLLDRGADPVDSVVLGNAMVENSQFFDLLLEKHRRRYSVIRPRFGCYALIRAVELGEEQTIRSMLEKGLDAKSLPNMTFPTSPFGHAIINSTLGVIEIFLQNGCKPNSIAEERFNYGRGPYRSAEYGEVRYRMTAFLAAIETQNVSKIRLLHKYGADVNFPAHTRVKRTPLQQAAETGSIEVVELLIRLGAEVNAPIARGGGGTALQLAAIGGYIPVVCLLLNYEADVNAPAAKLHGRMALEGAAEHGRLDMVQLLLNAGAGNEGKDHGQFERAKALANNEGFNYIADFLEDYLQQRRQRVEPATPTDLADEDLGIGNPKQGIDSIDIASTDVSTGEDALLSNHSDIAPMDDLTEEDTLFSNEWFDNNVADSGTDFFQTDFSQTDLFQDSF